MKTTKKTTKALRYTITRGTTTTGLRAPVCTLSLDIGGTDKAEKRIALPIRECPDCGLLFEAHDVSEQGSFFGSCDACAPVRSDDDDRAEWRQILVNDPYGQALIDATVKWLRRANAHLEAQRRAGADDTAFWKTLTAEQQKALPVRANETTKMTPAERERGYVDRDRVSATQKRLLRTARLAKAPTCVASSGGAA